MKRLLITLFTFLLLQGFTQEPATTVECPAGSHIIAKYHPDDYDGQDFETGFEFGAEYIDIGGMNWNDNDPQEVWMITWFVQYDNHHTPISAAFMKAGQDGELFIYEPPKTVQTPAEPITLQTDGKGISHITWCTPDVPTAITLSSFEVDASGTYTGLFLLLVGGAVALLILLSLIVTRTWRK